jgi:D-alanyl-lipoteichoic acid acyltransferase DltB (MBOAT superfamily)
MLFNSYEFLFGFLPVTLAGFFVLGAASRALALTWLVAASLGFYAWWRPINVLIIAPSIVVNYLLARALARPDAQEQSDGTRRALLVVGILFNVAFLGYFKYTNFFADVVNDLTGRNLVWSQVILPLGISFITFQKIAFLVDVHARRVTTFTFGQYLLFVLFFPQLIAGPIVHYRELMPQFERVQGRFNATDVAAGLTLLGIGLFKKVVLADGVSPYVTPIYEAAAAGTTITFVSGWIAALGFTLQIYFDFSGYSDMALGLGRCFGVRLPVNFDSPLKASSIIDFWARWHMTLTRFLAGYLYNPLVLGLTRRRLARGQPAVAGRKTPVGAFVPLLVIPTLLTMAVSGLWHGAGYTFILWGLLHGAYLVVNHAWRFYGPKGRSGSARSGVMASASGFLLTFAAVVAAMVLFRSPTLATAGAVFSGMMGVGGIGAPQGLGSIVWIGGLLFIALVMPNSLDIMRRYEPAIGVTETTRQPGPMWGAIGWRPSLPWAVAIGLVLVLAISRIGPESEFLYWQF